LLCPGFSTYAVKRLKIILTLRSIIRELATTLLMYKKDKNQWLTLIIDVTLKLSNKRMAVEQMRVGTIYHAEMELLA
jgi:hypothetical protein